MNSNCTNNFTTTLSPNMNATLSDNLTFQDIITNPFFYGGIIIFIILLSCIITFIFILKSKKKFLFSTNLLLHCANFPDISCFQIIISSIPGEQFQCMSLNKISHFLDIIYNTHNI